MHYYMGTQLHRRASDGIHWNPDGVRFQVNQFLTHFCLSRGIILPGVMEKNKLLDETIQIAGKANNFQKDSEKDKEDAKNERKLFNPFANVDQSWY